MASEGRRYQVRWVDVFTERPLKGNPLAVVIGAEGLAEEQMQAIARETNLSETTFLLPPDNPEHAARVRIFTPYVELPFAGHPTIGTAWVLLQERLVRNGATGLTLEEGIGPVAVHVDGEGPGRILWMVHPPVKFGETIEERDEMAGALGLSLGELLPGVPIQVASTGLPFVYVALRDPSSVDAAVSSGQHLASLLGSHGLPPVFLFAVNGENRLYSRMFGPHSATQVTEDPATGSASGPLGAFAVRYGLIPRAPKVSMVSEQGTKMGRQSFVHIKLGFETDNELPDRIEVGGSVVPVLSAELTIR
jgi:trans-2,3-dihydro-3-hydroxyanthranilate isomerase